ncbi:MAG: hypothetical protein QM726_10435 [Chitinophagaceae bacterium]
MAKATKKKSSPVNKLGVVNSLVNNINKRKEKGISRKKKDSTITGKAYQKMQEGWPKTGHKK